jgi:hypothetical protein
MKRSQALAPIKCGATPDDKAFIYMVSGYAITSGLAPISFAELEEWSLAIKEPITIPSYVDEKGSFIFTEYSSEYIEWLEMLEPIEKVSLESEISLWVDLVKELAEKPELYHTTVHQTYYPR